MKKYSELSAPSNEEDMGFEDEMMNELDLEEAELESEASDLTAISDDELMAEFKARGLSLEEAQDSDESEEDELDEESEMGFE